MSKRVSSGNGGNTFADLLADECRDDHCDEQRHEHERRAVQHRSRADEDVALYRRRFLRYDHVHGEALDLLALPVKPPVRLLELHSLAVRLLVVGEDEPGCGGDDDAARAADVPVAEEVHDGGTHEGTQGLGVETDFEESAVVPPDADELAPVVVVVVAAVRLAVLGVPSLDEAHHVGGLATGLGEVEGLPSGARQVILN